MLILIKLQVELSKLLSLLKSKLNFNIGLKFRKLREIEAFFVRMIEMIGIKKLYILKEELNL